MLLPGGVMREGGLRRDYAFRPLTGEIELGLAEAVARAEDLPGQVTLALQASLAQIGGLPPDDELVSGMSVGDRQFLMTRLAALLGPGQVWLTASCARCGEAFDFPIDLERIPAKPAGEGFPAPSVHTSRGKMTLRVPTGKDQRAILHIDDLHAARHELAKRCITAWDGGDPSGLALDEDEVSAIEAAIESVAPEVACEAQASCPECGFLNRVAIDPYFILGRAGMDIFDEVHRLAWHYHWSETEILRMPRWRRQRYLALIDRSRGMIQ